MPRRSKRIQKFITLTLILALLLAPAPVMAAGSQSLDGSVEKLRDSMVARESVVLLYFYSWNDMEKKDAVANDLFYAACSEEYSNSYNTGAYLKSSVKGCDVSLQKIGADPPRWKVSFNNILYRTTAEQEAAFDERLQQVMAELNLWEEDDYQKCSAIYDYITTHVTYDHEAYQAHLQGDDTNYDLSYTAYGALINGKAVCQGFATLFYAMCKSAGLEVLMVDGIAMNGDGWGEHAWNMVRVDGYWYQADPTWDSEPSILGYRYFLKGTDTFKKHRLNLEYTQESFTSTHIMPLNSYKNSVNENLLIKLFRKVKGLLLGE